MANLSSQIGFHECMLQTMHSQEQVPQLGWLQYLHAYSTAWKPLLIPVDSLGSLHSEFKHYIHSLKLNCEKNISFFMDNASPCQKSALLTPGTCRHQTLWDTYSLPQRQVWEAGSVQSIFARGSTCVYTVICFARGSLSLCTATRAQLQTFDNLALAALSAAVTFCLAQRS